VAGFACYLIGMLVSRLLADDASPTRWWVPSTARKLAILGAGMLLLYLLAQSVSRVL
jgi:hypothetical protein